MSVRLDIKDILYHIDKKDYEWFDQQTPELQATFNPFVVMQYISASKNDTYYLEMSNLIINKNFSVKSKNKSLFYRLCCVVGTGERVFHPYTKPPKSGKKSYTLLARLISEYNSETVDNQEATQMIRLNKKLYGIDFWVMIAESMEWSKDDLSKLELELKPIYKN